MIIDGDTVYIDDPNVYIAVTPHTTTGGWVNLIVTSKRYEGSVDLAFGFNRDKGLPSSLELYNPHDVITQRSFTVPDIYFSDPALYKVTYTAFKLMLWTKLIWNMESSESTISEDWILEQEIPFETYNKAKKTVYWAETKHVEWQNIAKKVDIRKIDHVYQEMDRWYVIRADVQRNREYRLRFWLDVVPSQSGGKYEYFVGVKPSVETLKEAIASGHFYFLDPWWDNSWTYKSKLTIDQTKIDADLTDFPVLIHLTSARVDWTHVQDDLDDIRFVDSTETTVLKAELEKYVLNDEAWIWVKIPTVSGTVDTDFYMYYGNAEAASAWDAENVWEASAVMVQHMVDATTSTILDSTANNNDGTKKGVDEPIETASGKLDSAQSFDGTNDYIKCGDSDVSLPVTLEAWIYADTVGALNFIIQKGDAVWAQNPYLLTLNNGRLRAAFGDNLNFNYKTSTPVVGTEAWHHVAGVLQGKDNIQLYIDGAEVAGSYTGTATTNANNNVLLRIGSLTDYTYLFDGIIDEARIYNSAKSATWIKADYNSGADTLLTYGAESELIFDRDEVISVYLLRKDLTVNLLNQDITVNLLRKDLDVNLR